MQAGGRVPKGYRLFYPQGRIRIYKGQRDFMKELEKSMRRGDDIGQSFIEAFHQMFPDGKFVKEYLGVGKNKVYLLPEQIAERYKAHLVPSNPGDMAVAYRKSLNLWRDGVLVGVFAGRWQLNNFVGNTMMSILDGSFVRIPEAIKLKIMKQFDEVIPPELLGGGMFGKGKPKFMFRDLEPGRPWYNKILPTLERGRLHWAQLGYNTNNMVDDLFRGAAYLKRVKPLIRKQMAKNNYKTMGALALDNIDNVTTPELVDILNEIRVADPAHTERMTLDISRNVYDFAVKTPTEKWMTANTHPFVSWWKFVNSWVMGMAVDNPAKIGLMGALNKIGHDIVRNEMESRGYTWNPEEDDLLPIPIGDPDETGKFMTLRVRGGNPLYDLFDPKQIIAGATPIAGWGFRALGHYDPYRGRKVAPPEHLSPDEKVKAMWAYGAWDFFTNVVPYGYAAGEIEKIRRPYAQYPTATPFGRPQPYVSAEAEIAYPYMPGPLNKLLRLFGINIREEIPYQLMKELKAEMAAEKGRMTKEYKTEYALEKWREEHKRGK